MTKLYKCPRSGCGGNLFLSDGEIKCDLCSRVFTPDALPVKIPPPVENKKVKLPVPASAGPGRGSYG
ncbi:MAG: hypothetical protein PHG35_02060 [Dehalococcoidales bacterium]|nr:hypothetical protein [Dehalococcoidales bacterium]